LPVVLASASPTRRELLEALLADFEVLPPRVDEDEVKLADPRARAVELARRKAREVASRRPGAVVIGADTLVACEGELIGKPKDLTDAARILRKLTHNAHSVITGVAVLCPDGRERTACVETVLHMRPMSEEQIAGYLRDVEPLRRAGAYAIQADDPNVKRLEGSVTGVMGLPLEEVADLLEDLFPEEAAGK
jgi:septum formation protein